MNNINKKNSYQINLKDIVLRRAKKDDNMAEIARLIYETDPYIYPFWFNEDIEEAIAYLVPKIMEQGFIFNYENCYVAYDKTIKKIVGIICAIDPTTDLEYDYTDSELINEKYSFTINNYIRDNS